MEGELATCPCIHRAGYGPGAAYCKTHTRQLFPEYETKSKRAKLPPAEQKETPWAKKVFAPFTGWRLRLAWPAGSVLLRRNSNGMFALPRGRGKMPYGLGKGTGDYVGWKSVIVTPDMVGKRIAVFLSVEAKRDGKELAERQQLWHETVLKNGGISMRASPDCEREVLAVLSATDYASTGLK